MRTRSQSTRFMDLPVEMLGKIFEYCEQHCRLQLRFTCLIFKEIIDSYSGILAVIDEYDEHAPTSTRRLKQRQPNEHQKSLFLHNICIREARIRNLRSESYFRYPSYLNGITFFEGIKMDVIWSTLSKCINLRDLQITAAAYGTDTKGQLLHLPKLRTLTILVDPFGSPTDWNGAEGILNLLQQSRAPVLYSFYMDAWVSPSSTFRATVLALTTFLHHHCDSLVSVTVSLNHLLVDETTEVHLHRMRKFVENEIEPLLKGRNFTQKSFTLSNLKTIEYIAVYPFLKAQTSLEKLSVTGWTGQAQEWCLYLPVCIRNVAFLQSLHLSLECPSPLDFSVFKQFTVLKELALFVNPANLNVATVNGINVHMMPGHVEILILSNFLFRTAELEVLSQILKKIKNLALVQISGMPVAASGMRLDILRNFIRIRSMRTILICGVWFSSLRELADMQNITHGLMGRREYFLMTEFGTNEHEYWNIIKESNNVTAHLTFHLLLRS